MNLRVLGILAFLLIAGGNILDWLHSLPDDEELAFFSVERSPEGACVLNPGFGPATYNDWNNWVTDVFNPPVTNPDVNDHCQTARRINLDVTVPVQASTDNVSERWYVYVPNATVLTGSGPWAMSIQLTAEGNSPLSLPDFQVSNGFCYEGAPSNLNAPVVDTHNVGCHDFSVSTLEPIFVRVVARGGGSWNGNFALHYGACVTDPGVDCASAITILNGLTVGPFTLESGSHWFKVAHVTGNYRLQFLVTAMDGQSNVGTYWGPDCDNLTPDLADALLSGLFCTWDTLLEDTDLWIQITIGTSTTLTYTLTYLRGGQC